MSGLFYVFLKWSSSNNTHAANLGRYMLCLSSRYEADELFRGMQGLQTLDGRGLLFTSLTRESPQFWCYESPDDWPSVMNFQERNDLPQFKKTLSSILLNDQGGRVWPIIPNAVSGPDWVSGGDFFIRNRRQPELYWYLHETNIHISKDRRTKFRIKRVGPSEREPVIMIRNDKVTIQVIADTVTPGAVEKNLMFLCIGGPKGNSIRLTNSPVEWIFGSFVNKEVGVRWENATPEQPGAIWALAAHMPHGGGDEWELA